MQMALVRLRGQLKQIAGGAEYPLAGDDVAALLRLLERERPALRGWILDERGRIRQHINVFVNGEAGREETPVASGDAIDVLPAISGGG
jgi:molybdopterin synthase sulfur carrier subunit